MVFIHSFIHSTNFTECPLIICSRSSSSREHLQSTPPMPVIVLKAFKSFHPCSFMRYVLLIIIEEESEATQLGRGLSRNHTRLSAPESTLTF